MTEELKPLPCPFCGERPKITRGGVGISHWFNVECSNGDCEATVSVSGWATKASAIKAWNTRSPAWRDIESAPRDGTPILAFGLGKSSDGCGTDAKCLTIKFDGEEWVSMDDGYRPYLKPTHWMPLPQPPEEQE